MLLEGNRAGTGLVNVEETLPWLMLRSRPAYLWLPGI
jgi:hypothetical protein